MTTLTHARLLELLRYEPDTGVFTRRVAVGKLKQGAVFGSINGHGYLHGWLDGRNLYACHRLAWFYVYGKWPDTLLDHKDRNRANNRIDNLREATVSMNGENQNKRQRGRLDLPFGVSQNGSGFSARMSIQGKQFNLGTFKTPLEAARMHTQTRELFQSGWTE